MIDTHCHLLPGLDDGPATESEAAELARALANDGIATALCTPHHSRAFPTSAEQARARLDSLRATLREAEVWLDLVLGVEFAPGPAISLPLEELGARSVAGRFVVVEVQPDTPVDFFGAAVDRLAEADLLPIFAHPERSRGALRHESALDVARRRGALLQVVAPSLIGRWGDDVAAAAWRLVDTGRADLLASDAHGLRRRRCHLGRAAELVRMRLGENVAAELTERGPGMVLQGQHPGRDLETRPY